MKAKWNFGVGTGVGTCGELVQGVMSDGRNFHVTYPITMSSTVTVRLRESNEWEMKGIPSGRRKLSKAIQTCAERVGHGPKEVHVEHSSDLEVGKGLGSSTADIVAAARAVAAAAGEELYGRGVGDCSDFHRGLRWKHVPSDCRIRPEERDIDPALRLVAPVGGGDRYSCGEWVLCPVHGFAPGSEVSLVVGS